jgi:hypothetical protein
MAHMVINIISIIIIIKVVLSYDYYSITPGTSTITIPSGVTSIHVKLWGAGGAGSSHNNCSTCNFYAGGSGAYVTCNIPVNSGDNLTLLIGQGGRVASSYGSSSGNAFGGGGVI